MVLNRRLPGITARDVWCIVPHNVPTRLSRAGLFPGAACLTEFAIMHAPRQISLSHWARSKAAPLQFGARPAQILLTPGFWLLAPHLPCRRALAS
jgi:hypothetical protein